METFFGITIAIDKGYQKIITEGDSKIVIMML